MNNTSSIVKLPLNLSRDAYQMTKNGTNTSIAGHSVDHLGVIFSLQNAVLFLILIISVTGNSYIITMTTWSRWKHKQKGRKLIDHLTTHLALMDLLLVITSIPEMLIHNIYSTFVFGPIGCKIIYPLSTHAVITSALTLLIIAYERYQASKIQTVIIRSKYKAIVLSSVSFGSIVLVCPYSWILTYQSNPTATEASCFERWDMSYRRVYTLVLFMVQYACPALLMIYYYYCTWRNIRTSTNDLIARMSVEHTPLLKDETSPVGEGGTPPMQQVEANKSTFTSLNSSFVKKISTSSSAPNSKVLFQRLFLCRELTKKFTIIVLVFLIFALPNQLLWLYIDFAQDGNINFDESITNLSYTLTFANCVVNPIVYGKRNSKKYSTIFKGWRRTSSTD